MFSIVNNGEAQQCGCTKAYDIRIKKDWGYMIQKNRNKILEELRQASKVPLVHMFINHVKCSAEWCFNTRASEECKEYNYKDNELRCKENYNHVYNLLKNTLVPFQTDKVPRESLHMFDTQKINQRTMQSHT